MSETVHYKGTLAKVEKLKDETLEEQCKRLLGNKELESCYDSFEQMLIDEFYEKYIIHDNIVYSVKIKNIDSDTDIFNLINSGKDNFKFEVMYYNGGCSFDEAIEQAFKNLKLED